MTTTQRIILTVVCVTLAAGVTSGSIGCAPGAEERVAPAGSVETTRTFDNAVKKPPLPQPPPPPMLTRDPRTSVYSYLLWISYAYRILNSDVATMAFSPYEEVRVNSYVQLNRQEGRAIDQQLMKLDFPREPVIQEATATVPAVETWKYRYISTKTGEYNSPWHDATYDTTYTLVRDEGRSAWLVDRVDAEPRGEVK